MPDAGKRLSPSRNDVDVTDFVDNGGSAAIVGKDLKVTSLGGEDIFDKNELTEEEWTSVRWLRAYLNVRERDFLLFGKEKQIHRLVTEQLRKLYADNLIERQEAILQSEMQGLFGLSSAKYSRYVDEIKQEAIKNGADEIDLIKNT